MAEEITEEFLEKLNNSEVGAYMRLSQFDCSDETLEELRKLWGKPDATKEDFISKKYSIARNFPEVYEKMINENTFAFDKDNVKSISRSSRIPRIPCDILPSGLNSQNMGDIEEIVRALGITSLQLVNISDDIQIGDLPVKRLELLYSNAPKVDIGKLTSVEDLSLSIFLDDEQDGVDINFSENSEDYPELESIHFDYGDIELSDEMAEYFLTLPKISRLPSNGIRLLDNSYDVVVVNPDELELVLNSNYYSNHKKIIYAGTEPIPSKAFKNIGMDREINLQVSSPVVINDDFCIDVIDKLNLNITIEDDLHEKFTLGEISAMNEEISNILANAPPKEASDLEKAAYLYEKIGQNVEYQKSGIDHSLLGGLLAKKQVCYGYSLEFYILAQELGLECNMTGGNVYPAGASEIEAAIAGMLGTAGAHEWNQVKIDGKWYNIDLTFDSDRMRHGKESDYFLLSDEEFNYEYKRTECKRTCKLGDYLDEEGTFDFERYRSDGGSSHNYREPEKCDESYDRELARQALERQKRRVCTSEEMVAGMEEESQGIKTGDITSAMQTLVMAEQQRVQDVVETREK